MLPPDLHLVVRVHSRGLVNQILLGRRNRLSQPNLVNDPRDQVGTLTLINRNEVRSSVINNQLPIGDSFYQQVLNLVSKITTI